MNIESDFPSVNAGRIAPCGCGRRSRTRFTFAKQRCRRARLGTAAVEAAIAIPLLVGILLGAVDVGQSVYVAQVINEASREGARQASRFESSSETEVAQTVRDFVRESLSASADAGLSINFTNSSGESIPNGDLSSVASGSLISVQVVLSFDSVRWTPGFIGLSGRSIETTTIMRRE